MIDAELADTVVAALASGLVGLVVAVVAFPGRWVVEHMQRRRQAVLVAAREARRELRQAVLQSRRPRFWHAPARPVPQIDEAIARRTVDEALEQVVFLLAELPERRLYDLVDSAADLHRRGSVIPVVYSPQEVDDPRPVLVGLVDEALSIRIRRAYGGLRKIAASLRDLDEMISDAEVVAVERYREQRAANAPP